jgi:hypothetical protein
MKKTDLDAEYEDKLLQLQQFCDHIVTSIRCGDNYPVLISKCDKCEADIQFQTRLERDFETAETIEVISWHRIGSIDGNKATLHRFGKILSHGTVEQYYRDSMIYQTKSTLSEVVEQLIKGKPYSRWKSIINR